MNSFSQLELGLISLAIFLTTCRCQVQLWRFGIFKDFNPPYPGKFNEFCYLLGDWKDNHGNNVSISRGYMKGVFNVNLQSKGIIYKGGFLSRQYDVSDFSSAVQPVNDRNRTLLMMVSCATIDKKQHAYITLIPEANCPQQTPAFHDFARVIKKCKQPQKNANTQKLASGTSMNNILNNVMSPPAIKLRATYSTEDFQLPKGGLNRLQAAQREKQQYNEDGSFVQKIKNIFSTDAQKQQAQQNKGQQIKGENYTQFHLQLSSAPEQMNSQQQYLSQQQQQLLQQQKARQQAQMKELQQQYHQQLKQQDQQAEQQILFQQQEIF